MSGSDLEAGDTGEGACIRVVQSSLHASIMQASLFKVPEKGKEFEEDKQESGQISSPQAEIIESPSPSHSKSSNHSKNSIKSPKSKSSTPPPDFPQEEIKSNSNKSLYNSEKPQTPLSPKVTKLTSLHLKEVFDEKIQRKGKVDVDKRFYEFKRKTKLKIENLKEQQEAKVSEICTFQPKTLVKNEEKLSFPHFLDHMELVNENHKKNLEKLQNERAQEELAVNSNLFKPTLNKKTLKLVSKHKSSSNLYEKLFKEHEELKLKKVKETEEIIKQTCPFTPDLGKNCAELKPVFKVSERILQPIKSEGTLATVVERKSEKLISQNSEVLIRTKFVRELESVLPIEEINFDQFIMVLHSTLFIHSDPVDRSLEEESLVKQAWSHLSESKPSIPPSKLKDFLLLIQNLEDIKNAKLYFEYKPLVEIRKKLSQSSKEEKFSLTFPFKPEINQVSLEKAKIVRDKRMNSYSTARPEKVLLMIDKESKKKIDEKRKKVENDEINQCSFCPKVRRGPKFEDGILTDSQSLVNDYFRILEESEHHRCDVLFSFSKVEQEKKEKMMRSVEEADIEKNMSECTFTPDITNKYREGALTDRFEPRIKKLLTSMQERGKQAVHQRSTFYELTSLQDSNHSTFDLLK